MKTRNMTEEQVKRDVLLAAQPTKQFVTVEQVAVARALSRFRRRGDHHRRQHLDRRRLDRAVNGLFTRVFGKRPNARRRHGKKRINLALQGGGAHGAFTWGVLDHLLEDGRLTIDGISGASAGAVNAVMLADGLARGGPEEARQAARRILARGELRRRAAGVAARGDRPAVVVHSRWSARRCRPGSTRWSRYPVALRSQSAQHQSAEGPDRTLRRFRRDPEMRRPAPVRLGDQRAHRAAPRVLARERSPPTR